MKRRLPRTLLAVIALAIAGTAIAAPTPVTAGGVSSPVGATRSLTQPDTMPLPATSGTPKIEQVRRGQVVATYTKFGNAGIWQRSHSTIKTQPGDVFLVYPAVYEGPGQYPWIGPLATAGDPSTPIAPTNITIRGVTVNGRRPVLKLGTQVDYNVLGHGMIEVSQANTLTIENLDIDGTAGSWIDRAGIYIVASRNVTLRNMRIHGFQDSQHNGVFASGASSGTLYLDNVRMYDNGGWDGPSHNIYVNASTSDPNYTVKMTNSYASAVNVGHLFKSRAQVTVLTGNLFEGIDKPADWDCAESFDIDVPEGGRLTVTNNVLIKGRSGDCANGVLLRYAAETVDPARQHGVVVRNNTFIARSTTYDSFGHPNMPMTFYYPAIVPGAAGWPSGTTYDIRDNRFEGFPATGSPSAMYRGLNYVDVPG